MSMPASARTRPVTAFVLLSLIACGCGGSQADGALGPPPPPLPSDRGKCPDTRRALHDGRRLLEEAQTVMQLAAFDPTAAPRAGALLRNAVDCLQRTAAGDDKRRAGQLAERWRVDAQRRYAIARLRLAKALTDPAGASRAQVREAAAAILEMVPGSNDPYAAWLRRLARRTP